MKDIILFRFHNRPRICKNRLQILKKLNPNTPIYGLYGGEEKDFKKYKKYLKTYMNDIYCIRDKSARWKWQNGDLALALWYRDFGRNIDFDSLYIIEYDLVILEPLYNIYGKIPTDTMGLTLLAPLKDVEHIWHWTAENNHPHHRAEWLKLLKLAREKFQYNDSPMACNYVGSKFTKEFLEKYSTAKVPELAHDELRVPLFAQIFNIKMVDNKIQRGWFMKDEEKYFNCDKRDIDKKIIVNELKKEKGRRIFHPYKKLLNL